MTNAQISPPLIEVFAQNVRRLRQSMALTQEELAERAGVHRTYIGMLERAEKNATLSSIERLASALEVEPATLLLNLDT